ncbi:group III truncated hemoglobin [Pedobacter sp. JY14-1]|uniref:group III truncated hemoglobin n=1 Tax=Pedobacter sp. JY14-1 TaxID=3034151 RepID=UPI0023E2901D|nr:group III truncated hemoglobin [Pedobacter sp. JY14-1]
MKNDIVQLEDIQQLVDTFYGRVQQDPFIGVIFMRIIQDWPTHLAKMYTFWQTALLQEHTYQGRPFPPHMKMDLNPAHFDRWLDIWRDTIDTLFKGEKAEEAKWRGQAMATMFLSKIEYYKGTDKHPLI